MLYIVNFLDIITDLQSETFQPFRKLNDNPLYINSKYNQPGHIVETYQKLSTKNYLKYLMKISLTTIKKNTKMHCKTQVIELNLILRKKINRIKEETIEIEM